MARIAYIDGRYVPITAPVVCLEDRGYQFSDGIYEVCLAIEGTFWDEEGHLARMRRSLDHLNIDFAMTDASLRAIMGELLRRNRLRDALVYLQITRGVAPRNHPFPSTTVRPVLTMTARPFCLDASDGLAKTGVSVITQPDIRWGRVDIKSISLLPNTLAKQAARKAGAFEAWLARDGIVTEGASTNAWIVLPDGSLRTHPTTNAILGGITRAQTMQVASDLGYRVIEEAFTLEEAIHHAAEAFVSSATSLVMPVVRIDGRPVGTGAPGPVATALRAGYKTRALSGAKTMRENAA